MNRKRIELQINDSLHGLKEKNKTLSQLLLFAEKRIEVLEKFRYYLNSFRIVCKCDENIGNELIFNDLENQYELILNNKNQIRVELNEEIEKVLPDIESDNEFNEQNSVKHSINNSKHYESNDENNDDLEKCFDNEEEIDPNPIDPKAKYYPNNIYWKEVSSKEDFLKVQKPNDNFILGDISCQLKREHNLIGFRCNYLDCDYKNHSLEILKSHVNKEHTNEKPYECKICGKAFSGKPTLTSHKRVHAIKKFKCSFSDDCNFASNSESHFEVHMMRHKKIKPFKCTWPGCESTFVSMNEVKTHLYHRHSDERPISCEWPNCDARFKDQQGLKLHFRTHTGEKPHECEWPGCDAVFAHYTHLRRHTMAHNDIKNYVCSWPDCGKRFITSGRLKNHYMVHTGDKPFVCEWEGCVKRFIEKSKMKRHLNVHRKKLQKETVKKVNRAKKVSKKSKLR